MADLLIQKQRELHADQLVFSDKDIIVQLLTVFLASCVSWAFHYLGQSPDKVEKIFEEIKQICGDTCKYQKSIINAFPVS